MRNYICSLSRFILSLVSAAWIGIYGWLEMATGRDLFGLTMVVGDDRAYIADVDHRDFVDIAFSPHSLATFGTCFLLILSISTGLCF